MESYCNAQEILWCSLFFWIKVNQQGINFQRPTTNGKAEGRFSGVATIALLVFPLHHCRWVISSHYRSNDVSHVTYFYRYYNLYNYLILIGFLCLLDSLLDLFGFTNCVNPFYSLSKKTVHFGGSCVSTTFHYFRSQCCYNYFSIAASPSPIINLATSAALDLFCSG